MASARPLLTTSLSLTLSRTALSNPRSPAARAATLLKYRQITTRTPTTILTTLPRTTTFRHPPHHHSTIRKQHTIPRPPTPSLSNPVQQTTNTNTNSNPYSSPNSQVPKEQQPSYELVFTCNPCSTRSRHTISKQGYQHGSVLVTCPSCRNRHVISDNLKIFGDRAVTIEDLLRERGQTMRKGTLSLEADVEFWDDGSVTVRGEGKGGDDVEVYRPAEEKDEAGPPGSTFQHVRPALGKEEGEK